MTMLIPILPTDDSTSEDSKNMAAKKKATAKKAVAKKVATKKTAARATAAKKTAAKKTAAARTGAAKKPPSKSEILGSIAESTELSRKQVAAVFDALNGLIQDNLKPRGPGTFSVPGLMKIVVNKRPARKARKGINPFTGEETVFKAKPATKVVKIRPLKNLKDMV